jgi:Ca2+-binding RTX toxin-like protein
VPAGKAQTFGDDYIAGGEGDDIVLGQLGNDVLLGDGALEDGAAGALRIPTAGDPLGGLLLSGAVERLTDGHDYVEGGGGSDAIFGGLGRDDLIGGSSTRFSLLAPDQRPDGGDYIFGGAGTRTGMHAITGDLADRHFADADVIVGDNGIIDRATRAVTLLDGAGADEVHGESGNDAIHGGDGNDRLFGDADDDVLLGGTGHDWISGGTGQDGVNGDEGDDVIFGGLGDDALDGGAGDDAISGAEALAEGYAADVVDGGLTAIVRSDFLRPYNPGGLLHYGVHRAGQTLPGFALLDAAHPNAKILVAGREFFLNNDAAVGPKLPAVASDGDDRIAGGAGHDWLVGGTGRDTLAGGAGDDVLGADDDLTTGGGANLFPDAEPTYADHLTGGDGRDVFLTNGPQDTVVDADGTYSQGTPNQGGSPLPVQGTPGIVSSGAPQRIAGASLNPLLDPGKRKLETKKKAKKKKAKKKKRKKRKGKKKKRGTGRR